MGDVSEALLRNATVSIRVGEHFNRAHLVDVRQRVRVVADTLNDLTSTLLALGQSHPHPHLRHRKKEA